MNEKILIDGRLLSNTPTGISRYSHQIIQAFRKKYGKERFSVIVNPGYACSEDYNFIVTKFKPYNPLHFLFFSFFITKQDHRLYYSPFYSGIYFKSNKRKQVITVHDLMYLKIDNYFSESSLINKISKVLFNFLVRSTLKATDLVISVSETTRKDLREHFGVNSFVIGEGVNELNANLKVATQIKLESFIEVPYFLYVGNFRKQKNVSFLLKAFSESGSPYRLILVGDHQNKIVQEDHKNIILTGALSDQEIDTLYKNCLAFIIPSLYEGFGLPVLEAYCAGARVLSSNQGALMEFHNLEIHYFSPYKSDELITLLRKADQLSKPTELQIKNAKELYSWENQTANFIQNIEKLLGDAACPV